MMLFVPGASRRRFCLLARLGLQCSPSKRSRSMNSPSSGVGGGGGRRADESAAPTRAREGEDGGADAQEGILRWTPPRGDVFNLRRVGGFPQRLLKRQLGVGGEDDGSLLASEELAKVSLYLREEDWGAAVPPNLGLEEGQAWGGLTQKKTQ